MTMTETDDVGKLFVGGLSWETTKETLQSYFSRFGEVVDSVVMKNNETGRSRGFGFVTFKDPACVNTVLQTRPHELNGRTIDAKECTPRGMQRNKRAVVQGKVFLGGLPPDVTETDIRTALSRFGKVNQVTIMCDQETKKCRGFGFLSFESEDSIEQACGQRFVNLNGKQIECKRAEPRDSNNQRNNGRQFGNQNGGGRQGGPSYGNGGGGYQQGGWNQQPQQYAMQGQQAYGNYPGYNAMGANQYAGAVPYNSMQPAAQYAAQPTYPNYGYGYTQPPAAGYAQPAAYGQAPAAGYAQPAAPVADAKSPQAASYGGGYTAPTAVAAGRGQGYHPYRR